MSHEKMSKETRDQLDALVFADVKDPPTRRWGAREALPWSGETMRVASTVGRAGALSAITRAVQRLRKQGVIVHSNQLGWRVVPRCKTCNVLLPHGKLVQTTVGTWCIEHAEDMQGPTW